MKVRFKLVYEVFEFYGKQKFLLKVMKFDFQIVDIFSKLVFDSDDDDDVGEGLVLFRFGK